MLSAKEAAFGEEAYEAREGAGKEEAGGGEDQAIFTAAPGSEEAAAGGGEDKALLLSSWS